MRERQHGIYITANVLLEELAAIPSCSPFPAAFLSPKLSIAACAWQAWAELLQQKTVRLWL